MTITVIESINFCGHIGVGTWIMPFGLFRKPPNNLAKLLAALGVEYSSEIY